MKPKNAIAFVILMAGCAPQPGIVSDFNGASVKIRQDTFASIPQVTPQIEAEAQRICGAAGKSAEFASTMTGPNAIYAEHLFLCL
jgi:hypothetical protein